MVYFYLGGVMEDEFVECTECGELVEPGFVDDNGMCDECWDAYNAQGYEPDEAQEWHDFDPDC